MAEKPSHSELAVFYAGLGLPVFPVNATSKKPVSGGNWREYSSSDPQVVRDLWRKDPDAVIAIDCGKSGLCVVDLDRGHKDGADGVEAFKGIIPENGSLPDIPRVLTPNGGQHLYFSNLIDQPLGNSKGDLPPGIDIRGNGGYVIACGSSMADGRQYTHDAGSPKLSDLLKAGTMPPPPAWLIDRVQPKRLQKAETLCLTKPFPVRDDDTVKVAEALKFISPDERDIWLRVGGALHDSEIPNAFQLWDDWSRGSSKYDQQDQNRTWKSFARKTGARAGIGTIFHLAVQNGFKHTPVRQESTQVRKDVVKPSEVTLIRAAELVSEPIDWLWPGWLAHGKFHIIGGAPGSGKTTICMKIAAIVSSGGVWPDGGKAQAGNVIVWSGEDDPRDTLMPRLIASGADTSRIYFVGECAAGDRTRSFDPSKDIEGLKNAIDKIGGADLIVIDPIVNAISGDSHKNAEVRRDLQPLATLAAACRAAVLGITHLSKGTVGRDPLERLTGSLAFGAVARVVMIAAREAETADGAPPKRFVCRVKSNIGPDHGGFSYDLVQTVLKDNPAIAAPHVVFGPAIDGTAREILAAAETVFDGDKSVLGEAVDFLRDFLSAGPKEVDAVKKAARAAGVAERTLRRAKERLSVQTIKSAFSGSWVWRLPEGGHEDSQTLRPGRLGKNLEKPGHLRKASSTEIAAMAKDQNPPSDEGGHEDDHEDGQTPGLGHLGQNREKPGHLRRVSATKMANMEKDQNPPSCEGGQPSASFVEGGHEDGQKNPGKLEDGQPNEFGHLGAEVGRLGADDDGQDEVYL